MKKISKFPQTTDPYLGLLESTYNRIALWFAKRHANFESECQGNRRYYVLDIFNQYVVVNRDETKGINKRMPKGNRMTVEGMLKSQVYITPDKSKTGNP